MPRERVKIKTQNSGFKMTGLVLFSLISSSFYVNSGSLVCI